MSLSFFAFLVNFEKHILSSWSVLRKDGCEWDVPDPGLGTGMV